MLAHELIEAGLDSSTAAIALEILETEKSAQSCWIRLSKELLRPDHPFEVHQRLHRHVFQHWNTSKRGPAPCWFPTEQDLAESNLGSHLAQLSYTELHQKTVREPQWFGATILEALDISSASPPQSAIDLSKGPEHPRWFPDMELNIALSCFLKRDPNAPAVVWGNEGEPVNTLSVAQLEAQCHRVAWGLQNAGFKSGDAVAIDMPMTSESVVIYLGCVLAGCVVVSIADSFAPGEIRTRLEIAEAKGIFTQDVILRGGKEHPLYERVQAANAPMAIVLPARDQLCVPLRTGDVAWNDFLPSENQGPFPVPTFDAESLTNILFSSGTTGTPKAIGWTHITPIKAAADGWGHHDIQAGDVVCWPTNLGWMMGPWLIYASLLNGATIALYEGIPSGAGFCRFVQDTRVTMLGVVPSLVRAWKASKATAGVDWSSIRAFSSTGEASNPDEMHWLMSQAYYQPVIEYCGGTEIGGGYICGSRVQPQVPATFSTPALGVDFFLIDSEGAPTSNGEIALVPPLLGSSQRLLNRDHHTVYFKDMPSGPEGQLLRRHGDQMESLPGGFFRALGRVDDTMNLGGIKVSSAELERACAMPELKECAAIAVSPQGGGPSQLVLFVVMKPGSNLPLESIQKTMQTQIRSQLNPLFKVHAVEKIDTLPRTASNKVMRRLLRAQFQNG